MTLQDHAASAPGWRSPSSGLVIGLLIVLSLLPFANTPRGGFVYDDHQLIEEPLSQVGGISPLRALSLPYWVIAPEARLWRPVASASLASDWKLGGGSPMVFHFTNMLLHAVVVVLLYLILGRVLKDLRLAAAAAAIFAVHPLHTEAVTWISGRAELLAAGFSLAALILALCGRPRLVWLTPVAVLFAVGSKESAAMIPVLLLFTRWGVTARERRPAWGPVAASFAAVVVYLLLRRIVLGTWSGPMPEVADNPMSGIGLFHRLPTVLDIAGRYLALTVWPAGLSIDYSPPAVSLVRGVTPYLALGFATVVALAYLAIRQRTRAIGWGAGFALLTIALTSNVPFVIGTIMAERLLYLPSAGLVLVAVSGVAVLASRAGGSVKGDPAARGEAPRGKTALPPAVWWGLTIAVIVALGARTWVRNMDYRNDLTLFAAALDVAPESPKVNTNLALQLNKTGRHEEAVVHARKALSLNPTLRDARDIVASSLEFLGRHDEAIAFLGPESARDPGDRTARRRLVELLLLAERKTEADSILSVGRQVDGEAVEWTVRGAELAQGKGDFVQAAILWAEALRKVPDAFDAALRLAYCQIRSGNSPAAISTYEAVLSRHPDSYEAANGLAWCLLETGGSAERAVQLAEAAVARHPIAPYLDTLSWAYLKAGRCADAFTTARRAVDLAPTEPSYQERLVEIQRRCP